MNPTWLYVGVVYAAAVAGARRARAPLPWRIAALFYLLVLIFLFRPMTGPYVNFPADFVRIIPPWSALRHGAGLGQHQLNDLTMQIVPWAHQVRESWRSFEVPLWNARSAAGYPLLANGQSSALSLLRIVALPLPLGYALTAEAAMKFLIALTFTFLLCRRRGWGEIASTIAATGFAFGTFMTVWLHFPLATVACLLPAALYALELLLEARTYHRIVFGALVWVVILFGGHPETAAHIGFVCALWTVWVLLVEHRGPWRERLAPAAGVAAALAIAAVLASPFIAPFAEGLTKSKRFHEIKANTAATEPAVEWPIVVALFEPHYFGDVPIEEPWGPEHPELITAFTGILGVASFVALLLHAIVARRFRSREFFLVVATLLVLGTLLDWPVISPLVHGALVLAANGRLRLVLGFLFALQSAAAIDLLDRALAEAGGAQRKLVTLSFLTGVAVVALAVVWFLLPGRFDIRWHETSSLLALLPSIAVLGIAAAAVVVPERARSAALMLLLTAAIGEVWTTGISWNPVEPAYEMYPSTPMIRKLHALRDAAPKNEPSRFTGIGGVIFPNLSGIYGLDDVRAHDPMAGGRYLGVLRVVAGYDPSDYFAKWQDIDSKTLNYLNVRYVAVAPGFEVKDRQRYVPVYDGVDGAIYENRDVLPRFFSPPIVQLDFDDDRFVHQLSTHPDWSSVVYLRRLDVTSDRERKDLFDPRPAGAKATRVDILDAGDTHYRMRVDAPRYSIVVSSIPLWPGWRVIANGRTLAPVQVNGAFLGFLVPPGVSDVRVDYAPLTFRIAAVAALIAAAAMIALSRRSVRLRVLRALRVEGALR